MFNIGDLVSPIKDWPGLIRSDEIGIIVNININYNHGGQTFYGVEINNLVFYFFETQLKLVGGITGNSSYTIILPDIETDPSYFGIDWARGEECECGTKNPYGQGHSHWCKKYRKEM